MSKSSLSRIKSKNMFKYIIKFLDHGKVLKIFKYSKKYKKILGLSHNDYKDYSWTTELEIIPQQNMNLEFINILEINEKYFHIFFNENTNETKQLQIKKDENIEKIRVKFDCKVNSMSGMFRDKKYIKSVNFIKFNRTDIDNMSCLFKGCSSLEEINFTHFNTDNVYNMASMFDGCMQLIKKNRLKQF